MWWGNNCYLPGLFLVSTEGYPSTGTYHLLLNMPAIVTNDCSFFYPMHTIHAADTLIDFDNNTLYVKHARIMQLLSILQSKSSSPQWYCQHRQSIESVMTLLIHPAAASSGWRSRAGRNIFRPWHSIWGTRSARRASKASKPMMGRVLLETFLMVRPGVDLKKYTVNFFCHIWFLYLNRNKFCEPQIFLESREHSLVFYSMFYLL